MLSYSVKLSALHKVICTFAKLPVIDYYHYNNVYKR